MKFNQKRLSQYVQGYKIHVFDSLAVSDTLEKVLSRMSLIHKTLIIYIYIYIYINVFIL